MDINSVSFGLKFKRFSFRLQVGCRGQVTVSILGITLTSGNDQEGVTGLFHL